MLDEIDASQFTEWLAFEKIQEEDYKRAELASRAEAGVKNYTRGGR